ncbi:hypothetical protein [Streptomyces bohaiensis]|uniref:hypothetical protein n=1 Tax=Streptomyces bohaiensis TaxID=1431344 RepID=UPI003B819440
MDDRAPGTRAVRPRDIGLMVMVLLLLAAAWGCARIVDGSPVPRADVRETTGRMQSTLQTAYDAAIGTEGDAEPEGGPGERADRPDTPDDAGTGPDTARGDGGDDGELPTAPLRVNGCHQTGMRAMSKQLEPGVYRLDATWSLSVPADDAAAAVRRVTEALLDEGWQQPESGPRQEEHYVHLRNGDDGVTVKARQRTSAPDPAADGDPELDPDDAGHDGSTDGSGSADDDSSAAPGAASGGEQRLVSVDVRTDCARQDAPARLALPLLPAPTPEEASRTVPRQ